MSRQTFLVERYRKRRVFIVDNVTPFNSVLLQQQRLEIYLKRKKRVMNKKLDLDLESINITSESRKVNVYIGSPRKRERVLPLQARTQETPSATFF